MMTPKELLAALEAVRVALANHAPGLEEGVNCLLTAVNASHDHCVRAGDFPRAENIENGVERLQEAMRFRRSCAQKAKAQG